MHQVKLFKGLESELHSLEAEINAFLAEKGAAVVNVFGNIAPQSESHTDTRLGTGHTASDIFIVVVYEKP